MHPVHRYTAMLLAVLALASHSAGDGPCAAEAATTPAEAPTTAPSTAATPATATAPAATTGASEAVFKPEELDQMLAPIALYPDALLAQILMAATYPGNVADAVAWSKAHPDAKGDDAVRQVAEQSWDPSVQSLVAFPEVLATLGQDPIWVQRLGDAFLAQPNAVMDSVQRLRQRAQAAGHLKSNEQMKVSAQPAAPTKAAEPASATQTIIIEPADPQVVYVPSYDPNVVYGSWPAPSYPPTYYPPSPAYTIGTALAAGLAFGAGVAIIDSLWGDCDWGHGDVDIDVNRYNNLNSNRQLNANQKTWQHNPVNRQGVPYRDRANQERYGRRLEGGEQRAALRGQDSARAADRERARQSLAQRGIEAPATSNRQARERAQTANRDLSQRANSRQREQSGAAVRQRSADNPKARQQARERYASAQGPRNNAFADARSPTQSRANFERGQASRANASRPQAERVGRPVQRPASAPSRSAGGRRR